MRKSQKTPAYPFAMPRHFFDGSSLSEEDRESVRRMVSFREDGTNAARYFVNNRGGIKKIREEVGLYSQREVIKMFGIGRGKMVSIIKHKLLFARNPTLESFDNLLEFVRSRPARYRLKTKYITDKRLRDAFAIAEKSDTHIPISRAKMCELLGYPNSETTKVASHPLIVNNTNITMAKYGREDWFWVPCNWKPRGVFKRKCLFCSKEFVPNRRDHRYCSVGCCHRRQRMKAVPKPCVVCGEIVLTTRDTDYPRCPDHDPIKPRNHCLVCGKEVNRAKLKVCSKACADQLRRDIAKSKRPTERACMVCGKLFPLRTDRLDNRKCCSRACGDMTRRKAEELRATPKPRACVVCGVVFTPRDYRKQCCSRACGDVLRARGFEQKRQTKLLKQETGQ